MCGFVALMVMGCTRGADTDRAALPAADPGQFDSPLQMACWTEPGAWPQFMHDPLHSGRSDADFAGEQLEAAWQFRPSDHIFAYQEGMSVWSSPVGGTVEGRPLVIAGYCDRNVYAVDGRTGEKVWEFSPGAHVFATPALVAVEGRALVVVAATNRSLYGLDAATGQKRWTWQAAEWSFTQPSSVMSSPTVVHMSGVPVVFAGVWHADRSAARNVQSGELVALNAADGSLRWRKRLASVPVTSPIVVVMGGRPILFVATQHGNVIALRCEDGAVQWESTLNEGLRSSVSAGWADGRPGLFVGTRQHSVFALDPTTGQRRWRSPADYWIDATPALVTGLAEPLVVAGSYDRRIYAWRGDNGGSAWSYATGNYAYSSPAIVRVGGRLAVFQMSWDQGLYLLDAAGGKVLWKGFSGPLIWSHAYQGDSLWASPAAVRFEDRSLVIFPAGDGILYAYR